MHGTEKEDVGTCIHYCKSLTIDVCGFVDNAAATLFQHPLEQRYKTDETDDDDDQGQDKAHSTRDTVVFLRCPILEKDRALIGLFVASNQTKVASGV